MPRHLSPSHRRRISEAKKRWWRQRRRYAYPRALSQPRPANGTIKIINALQKALRALKTELRHGR